MRKRRNRNSFNKNLRSDDTLSDRALTTGLLYNYLEYVSPTDVDGLKRAYVNINNGKISAKPIAANKSSIAQMYGKPPTLVSLDKAPTALITRYSPKDRAFPELEAYSSSIMRAALRKIVDEV